MPNNGERFTAYLSPVERIELRRLARRHRVSENYIVRLALRQLLQIPDATPGPGPEVHLTAPKIT